MVFEDYFNQSWKEYKTNFKSIFKFVLIFYGLFLILRFLVDVIWVGFDEKVRDFVLNPEIGKSMFEASVSYLSISFLLSIIGILLSLFISGGILAVSLKGKRFRFEDIVSEGKSFYFRYFWFNIVLGIFLVGLFLLLIIPGIIFSIYWIFGVYVLYDEREGILKSLKKSRNIVRGRWWGVLGNGILITLIGVVFSLVISLILLPTQIFMMMQNSGSIAIPYWIFMVNLFLGYILDFVTTLVFVPFSILFFKNFYLDLKSSKKK
jgi:hypothetical protein